jgi:hypothetical protein
VCVGGGEHDENATEGSRFRIAVKHSSIMPLNREWNADDGVDERVTNSMALGPS